MSYVKHPCPKNNRNLVYLVILGIVLVLIETIMMSILVFNSIVGMLSAVGRKNP